MRTAFFAGWLRTVATLSFVLTSSANPQTSAANNAPAAKSTPAVPDTPALRDARHSLMLVSTRAVALFRSADTIENRLQADGSTLHPATSTLRMRIEHNLNAAESALHKGEVNEANDHIKAAEALADRYARRIGAE